MNYKLRPHHTACPNFVHHTYNTFFAGQRNNVIKLKNARVVHFREGGQNVFLFKSLAKKSRSVLMHAMVLSDEAVDAMQVLKNVTK